MSTRIHVVVPDELLERVDLLRGDVPRSKFLVRAVEHFVSGTVVDSRVAVLAALNGGALEKALGRSSPGKGEGITGVPQPSPPSAPPRASVAVPGVVRASSLVKRDVKPIPKKS